ncbi:class I SAM-dependent DNA methyltransferase [Streptococcus mutans]|uniref:HsdM family class I SAM-dependent methyltransferase n=1 Tax=Streptococcus mutans TaxID=1309 RepID=UPI0038B83977
MVNEKKIDQWVRSEIQSKIGVDYSEQTSDIDEVRDALKGASKQGGKGVGKPEFTFVSGGFLFVVEDKKDNDKFIKFTDLSSKVLDMSIPSATSNYAVNGAVHYAKHISKKTTGYKEVFAIGVAGSGVKKAEIWQVIYYDSDNSYEINFVQEITDWSELSPENISKWYLKNVLKELTEEQRQEIEFKQFAANMHEDLRNYANLEGENKATVVSAILLALFSEPQISLSLTGGDKEKGGKRKDGIKIYDEIEAFIENNEISPEFKVNVVLEKFSFIKNNITLNTKQKRLGDKTPIRYFAEKLNEMMNHFVNNVEYDILGNFYGEFTKYGGSDGNSLGIVLTPRHITQLMAELIDVNVGDYVLDPTAGTGAFLISAMNIMMEGANEFEKEHIKQHQLYGIELQEKMYTVATTNMILRGDGKSNLLLGNLFDKSSLDLVTKDKNGQDKQVEITKVLMNPPYSQGSSKNRDLYELNFVLKSLSLMRKGGKLAVIIPQASLGIGRGNIIKDYKEQILEFNTLESVITLNPNTFYGQRAGTSPAIAIFTAGQPHPYNKNVKFINFKDDGYIIKKHFGLVDDGTAKQKKQHLLEILHLDVTADANVCVKAKVTHEDEWLHSYFYFDDSIPTESSFERTIQDYLAFKFDQVIHGFGQSFFDIPLPEDTVNSVLSLQEKEWDSFLVSDYFSVASTKTDDEEIELPYISAKKGQNGLKEWITSKIYLPPFSVSWNKIGDGGGGLAYYHPYKYKIDDINVLAISPIGDLQLGLAGFFVSTMLSRYFGTFSHGHTLSKGRFKVSKIMLPSKKDKNGKSVPDWEYMEKFILSLSYSQYINTKFI